MYKTSSGNMQRWSRTKDIEHLKNASEPRIPARAAKRAQQLARKEAGSGRKRSDLDNSASFDVSRQLPFPLL